MNCSKTNYRMNSLIVNDQTIQTIYLIRKCMKERIDILGAGLSGLAAATILAKAGKEVHVHRIRKDSGARFDGDFQGIENWTSENDFVDEMRSWGLEPEEFKTNAFKHIITGITRKEANQLIGMFH